MFAIHLALTCDAHLTALACTGLSRFAAMGDPDRVWPLVEDELRLWRTYAQDSLAAFASYSAKAGLQACDMKLLADDPEDAFMLQAPYHDLLILSQSTPRQAAPGVIRDLPQNLLLHSGRPLLLFPNQAGEDNPSCPPLHHSLLAWDGSRAAARAARDALPLLKQAGMVTLLVLNPEGQTACDGMAPGADMALFLSRHGVRVEMMCEYTNVNTGDALLCVASALRCDLLVMGGYGHRRAREVLLGGATQTVLNNMQLPVLISH